MQNDVKAQQYITLIMHSDYGLQNKHFSLDKTLARFDIDDDLRRRLKSIDVRVRYKKIQIIDLAEEEDNASATGQNLEIGKTVVTFPDGSYSYLRVSVQ